jgi:tubulin gamma
MRQQR